MGDMDPLSRRTLLQGALGAGIVATTPGWARKREPNLREAAFANGVASGIPAKHGATLRTRVDGLERAGRITLEVATDRDFANVIDRRRMRVAPGADGTGRIHVGGLPAGSELFYRFHTRTTESPVGRIRTKRPADSAEPVRVAFFSCQNWQTGYFTAHAGLAAEKDLDLAVCVGDFIYEAASDPGVREDEVGPDQSAQTLDEYRAKYRLYRSDPALQALHAAHPFAICWDDHEVESSYYRDHGGNVQGRERRVPFLTRRRNGYRAFFEHMPLARVPGERDRIYRRIPLGALAEVVLTDLHQYADPSPCEGAPSQGPVILVPCQEAKDPARTLLGRTQREWLEATLTRANRPAWELWGTSMMLMALDNAPGQPFTVGEWSGWEGERNALAASLAAKGVRDLAAFSGDIHTFFAGQWTTDGRATGKPVGVEFVSGSMTSSGIAESFGGQGAFTDLVRDLNPHIAYANTSRRGYAVVEATAEELRVIFRSPATVKEKVSEMSDLAAFRVERGTNAVEQTA
jgi:alkaline phosphatase D